MLKWVYEMGECMRWLVEVYEVYVLKWVGACGNSPVQEFQGTGYVFMKGAWRTWTKMVFTSKKFLKKMTGSKTFLRPSGSIKFRILRPRITSRIYTSLNTSIFLFLKKLRTIYEKIKPRSINNLSLTI